MGQALAGLPRFCRGWTRTCGGSWCESDSTLGRKWSVGRDGFMEKGAFRFPAPSFPPHFTSAHQKHGPPEPAARHPCRQARSEDLLWRCLWRPQDGTRGRGRRSEAKLRPSLAWSRDSGGWRLSLPVTAVRQAENLAVTTRMAV